MHKPQKLAKPPDLTLISQPELDSSAAVQQTTFDGSGGPPSRSMVPDAGVLSVFAAFGAIMVAISLFALANDPATATFRQTFNPTFGDFRIFFELTLFVAGTACIFPSLAYLRALSKARKIENGSDGRVKSFRAKKLEKISEDDFISIVGNYLAAFLS